MKNKQKLPFFGMNFYISNDLSVALFFSFHLPANFTKQQQLQQQQQNYELKTDLWRVSGHAEWQDHSHSKAKVKLD